MLPPSNCWQRYDRGQLPAGLQGRLQRREQFYGLAARGRLERIQRATEELQADITASGGRPRPGCYRLPLAASGAQLPQIPNATPGTHVIDRDQFHAMFTRVAVAAGTDQLLPLFSHVHTELTTTDTVLLPAPAMARLLLLCDGDQIILGIDGDTADQWITMTSGTLTAALSDRNTSAKITITPIDVTVAPGTRDNNATAPPSTPTPTSTTPGTAPSTPTTSATPSPSTPPTPSPSVFSAPGKPIKLTTDNDTYEHVVMLMRR